MILEPKLSEGSSFRTQQLTRIWFLYPDEKTARDSASTSGLTPCASAHNVLLVVYTECGTNGMSRRIGATSENMMDETGEQRWHATGVAQIERGTDAVLLVVHAYRGDSHGEEIIRIISARRAENHEIRRYQEQAMD
jgi:uncharacterized DUF497 family protein